ncbi:hypothetical protein HaLaN_21889 [Haematococcus lacustris]|uniref:Uncharacterized protein n=1 Tax=Haematococcus lacustris TaxID=44745 RepID=A0A699ZZD8_HAELA|nr:hypothetical protein HaLaN_21889 [Haematococcus lacustris]
MKARPESAICICGWSRVGQGGSGVEQGGIGWGEASVVEPSGPRVGRKQCGARGGVMGGAVRGGQHGPMGSGPGWGRAQG